jgi:subtilisin family serine protease
MFRFLVRCGFLFAFICLLYTGIAEAQRGRSAAGSRTELSAAELDALAVELNMLAIDARKAKQRCDRERYRELVELIAEKGRHANASMEALSTLMQQMSLRLTEISDAFKRHLPSGVGGSEIANLAIGEGISMGLNAAEAIPLVGTAINAVKTLSSLAEKEGAIRDVADIGNRLQEQYRQILKVLLSIVRWRELADKATQKLEDLALLEFENCGGATMTDYAGSDEEEEESSTWEDVLKTDVTDTATGEPLDSDVIVITDAGPTTGVPDTSPQPDDTVIVSAPCHQKKSFRVGDVPEGVTLDSRANRFTYECDRRDEVFDAVEEALGVSMDEVTWGEIRINGTNRCELLIQLKKGACPGIATGTPGLTDAPGTPGVTDAPGTPGTTDAPGTPGTTDAPGLTGIPGTLLEPDEERVIQAESIYFPDDPFYGSKGTWGQDYDDQWALKRIGFTPEQARSLWPEKGLPVVVAVIDTGVDRLHPELIGAVWINEDETPGNGKDDDGNGYVDDFYGWNFIDGNGDTTDTNGHGTVVAGIIAAWTDNATGIAGVNPWARIMPVKVMDFDGKGGSIDIAKAIIYAVDNGARVINLSIGGFRHTKVEQAAIDYAVKKGVLLVVASGNEGVNTAGFSPAGLKGAITVASTDPGDNRLGFSNWGRAVDIAAPGVDVLSLRARRTDILVLQKKDYVPGTAFVGKEKRYYRISGSSFSAPFVAGVASLILSNNPELAAEDLRRMILHSAGDVEVPGNEVLRRGRDSLCKARKKRR